MRWKTPHKGEVRTITKFALLPRELSDGWTVWFEWYAVDQIYYVGHDDMSWYEYWVDNRTRVLEPLK